MKPLKNVVAWGLGALIVVVGMALLMRINRADPSLEGVASTLWSSQASVEAIDSKPTDLQAQPEGKTGLPAGGIDSDADEINRLISSRSNLLDSYQQFVDLARQGSADAAYALFRDIQVCALAKARQNALESNAASAREEGREFAVMQAIAASERDEVFCAGVTEGQLKNSFEWLAMAARGGNVEAQSQFYVQALAKYESPQDLIGHADEVVVLKREAMQHLTHAAAAGNVQSIGALAVSGS